MSKVTKVEPDEIRINRFTGQPVVNTAEVNRLVEARLTPSQHEEQSRGRMTLEGMSHALDSLRERALDREQSVLMLTQECGRRGQLVTRLREQWEHAEESAKARLIGARVDALHLGRKLKYAEEELAAWQVRLETSVKILAAVREAILDWTKQHGAQLAEMRKLKYSPKVGDKF
jgi:hypothetical protein